MRSAVQFLTILPVPAPLCKPGQCAAWFPVVGAAIGLVAAGALLAPLGPVVALLVVAVITGGLHEDGLADVCDALRAGRSRERMLAILHDSRIGAHGALAVCLSVLLRWQALAHLRGDAWLRLAAAYGLSRATMVILAACSRPAGDGLGAAFIHSLPRWGAWMVAVQSVGLAALAGLPAAVVLLAANATAIAGARAWFHRRLGGVTGDCLGFQCQVSETLSLAILTCV